MSTLSRTDLSFIIASAINGFYKNSSDEYSMDLGEASAFVCQSFVD